MLSNHENEIIENWNELDLRIHFQDVSSWGVYISGYLGCDILATIRTVLMLKFMLKSCLQAISQAPQILDVFVVYGRENSHWDILLKKFMF